MAQYSQSGVIHDMYSSRFRERCILCPVEISPRSESLAQSTAFCDLAIYILDNVRFTPAGCALWTGPMRTNSYGGFYFLDVSEEYAHRALWTVFRGPIPDGLCVCHTC